MKEDLTQQVGKVEMLVSISRKRQLLWFGHVTRHNDNLALANYVMHSRAVVKRGRSRHVTRHNDNLPLANYVMHSRAVVKKGRSRHVTRHNDNLALANNVMHGRAVVKRGRSRPRVKCIQNMRDCTGLSAVEAVIAAQDRKEWKRRVEDSTVLLRS